MSNGCTCRQLLIQASKSVFRFYRALSLLCFLFIADAASAQNGTSLRVFLDCQFHCDQQFIRQELTVVDLVSERTRADVHVQGTSQQTGSGGREITLFFIGRADYAAMRDTLTYATDSDATDAEERDEFLQHLVLGLARYAARAGLADRFTLVTIADDASDRTEPVSASIEDDPWNYWVFRVGVDGNIDGQSTTRRLRGSGNVSASRTTEEWKVDISARTNRSESRFDVEDETITSTRSSSTLSTLIANSIGDNWAAGGIASLSTSSFNNTEFELEAGPAVEYNVFPYSASTRRLFTFRYDARLSLRKYEEFTIFAVRDETIAQHSLSVTLDLTQNWGSLNISSRFRHLLTNFDRRLTDSYNLNVFVSADFRLFRGLSLRTFGSYSRIRDQIDLPANAATREEILLSSVQLPTGYSYFFNMGLTYRFGSIFNNVVNRRL